MSRIAVGIVLALSALSACNKAPSAGSSGGAESSAVARTAASSSPAAARSGVTVDAASAAVGKAAPDFTLKDLDGKEFRLSSYKGKVVVLEWFNPSCPFVRNAHTKGSLKDAAKRHVKNGVVWLAINSGAAGKQGVGVPANREGAKKFDLDHPILLDESGEVGKRYGATNTPHLFVIDDKGVLVYRGAVDNSPDGEGESAPGGKLVSYVDETLAALASGKGPSVAETKAYGCSVKYAQ